MNKYHNGKIYKITDVGYNKCYIGSTCESLSQRMARHRWKYTQYFKNNTECTRSFLLFDEYGIDNCKIELIENFKCETKDELLKQEGEHIQKNNCINKQLAGRKRETWVEDNKEHLQKYKNEWYKENIELCKERTKKHREDNKEHYQQKNKEYREEHRGEILEKHRKYYQLNKNKLLEKAKEKINCCCGSSIRETI